jgi:prolyl-tRNA editing enzyme YbaK/EbsC (Cys-tRNA(Pro) deacylase)
MEWPEPVERVAAYLRAAGAEASLEEFPEGTPTAGDAARAAGCKLAQIVKSIVFVCDATYVVVLVPGDLRADAGRVARAVGARSVRIAAAAEVRDATGFEPGAVAPFPLPRVSRVLIDRALLLQDTVWIGAGSEHHLAELPAGDLVRLARAEPADVARAGDAAAGSIRPT